MRKDYTDAEFTDIPNSIIPYMYANRGAGAQAAKAATKTPFMSYGRTGLNVMGKNIGKYATIGNGIYQGIQGIQNLKSLSDASTNQRDIKSKILSTAAANPMNSSYLSADNMRLLRQLRNGTYDSDNTSSLLDILRGGATGVATGALGGPVGMLIGGIGGAINGGISSKANSTTNENEKLEALLAELEDAQAQYNQLKRPNFNMMGLQSRYTNQWI